MLAKTSLLHHKGCGWNGLPGLDSVNRSLASLSRAVNMLNTLLRDADVNEDGSRNRRLGCCLTTTRSADSEEALLGKVEGENGIS